MRPKGIYHDILDTLKSCENASIEIVKGIVHHCMLVGSPDVHGMVEQSAA